MATVSKSLKKEIIKNHLLGLNEDENRSKLISSGEHIDQETIREVIDEFGSEVEKRGVIATKSYGVSRFANDLAEVARFKRKNEIEFEDMLRGARVARVLKNYGAGIPELEQFLSVVYSRASKEGYDAESIVEQVSALDKLEKKHEASFDELKARYESLVTQVGSKEVEKNQLAQEIEGLEKRKSEVLQQSKIDEKRLQEYSLTTGKLRELGLKVEDLEALRNFLISVKAQGYDSTEIISRLNSIGELEKKKSDLERESLAVQSILRKKDDLLAEVTKLETSSLTVEQVGKIREIVERVSASRGIEGTKAYVEFEDDVVSNYDAVLGMKAVVARLQEGEKRLLAEADEIRRQLSDEQTVHSEKIKQLEHEYSKIAKEIEAYNLLVQMGVDASEILSWHEIIETSKIDFSTIEAELKRNANLKAMEREITQKVASLTSEAMTLKETVEQLEQEKMKIEGTIKALGETAVAELNSVNSTILSSIESLSGGTKSAISQIVEDNKKVLDGFRVSAEESTQKTIRDATVDLKSTVSQLANSVSDFSRELKKTIEEAEPQIKSLSGLLEAGERLGKYRNILPLLELLDEKNVNESEALIAMWNVISRFSSWVSEHYRSSPKPEFSETLSKLIASINEEIQRINQ